MNRQAQAPVVIKNGGPKIVYAYAEQAEADVTTADTRQKGGDGPRFFLFVFFVCFFFCCLFFGS